MASADTARYSDLCRLCATKTNMILAINIFDTQAKTRQINKKIETCLPVQIHEGDELPKMICENCLYKLELLFDFRERSLRTESLLIDLFKELNMLQVDQHMKMEVSQLDPADIVMVHSSLLNEQHMQHNDLDLTQLSQRENMIVGHEIILTHQNVSLDHIELSNHEINQELSNHSMQQENILVNENHLQNGRFTDAIEYHQEHHILTDQYSLSDINLTENNLQTQTSIKDNHHLIEEHSNNSEQEDLLNHMSLKHEDSNSENRLLIDENKEYILPTDANTEVSTTETIISHEDKEWLYCNMCGKTFEDKTVFSEHCDEHFNRCEICDFVFVNKDALISHRKEAHGDTLDLNSVSAIEEKQEPSDISSTLEKDGSECDGNLDLDGECEEEEEFDEPSTDVQSGSPKKKTWTPKVCKECGKVYKTNYKLAEHMRKHTGEQPFKCNSCDKAFRSKIGLAQHEAKHTGQYDYFCLTCGKGFQCKSYLMVHQRVHSDVKPYPCTTCGRNFKTKQSLLDHTNRHLGVKPYTCEICGRSFITKGLCRAHQKVHSGTDNRKYSCKVCQKKFVSKSYLQTHIRIHTGEKPFMCEVCGKGFLTRVDLKIHSTMHTGEKSYVCEICGKAFARRDALRCHKRSHTGERPYTCDICGQTFTQFSPMAIHKRLHTGERPYECETCGKKFVSRSTMMVHSKKHAR